MKYIYKYFRYGIESKFEGDTLDDCLFMAAMDCYYGEAAPLTITLDGEIVWDYSKEWKSFNYDEIVSQ